MLRKSTSNNTRENRRLALRDARLLRARKGRRAQCEPQDMRLWPELRVLGCLQKTHKGVRNGAGYTIASCDDEAVRFEELPGRSFSYEEVIEFSGSATRRLTPAAKAPSSTRASHCGSWATVSLRRGTSSWGSAGAARGAGALGIQSLE